MNAAAEEYFNARMNQIKNKDYKIKTYPEANKYLMTNNIAMISRGAISTINTTINELVKESV